MENYLSLKSLIHLLRHKEEWPEGFEWDFYNNSVSYYKPNCGCAMFLASKKFNKGQMDSSDICDALYIENTYENSRIFLDPKVYGFGEDDYDKVTPEMVAAKLEELL